MFGGGSGVGVCCSWGVPRREFAPVGAPDRSLAFAALIRLLRGCARATNGAWNASPHFSPRGEKSGL